MDIRSFMLTTGQELVAELIDFTHAETYVIKNPLIAHMMRGPDGAPQLGFAPWSMIHQDGIKINIPYHAVLAVPIAIEKQVADSYIQNTTGLVLPPSTSGQILMG